MQMRRRASSSESPASRSAETSEVGDALRGGAGAGEDDALIAHRLPGDSQRRVHAGDDDGRGALDVVVERAQPVAKARELGDARWP